MVKRLKIPSFILRVVKGPFKGYYAEFRSRLRQGEFIQVVLSATGQTATLPVENVVFLMEDGSSLQYEYNNAGGLVLKKITADNLVEEADIEKIKEMASNSIKISSKNINDDMDFSEYFSETSTDANKRKRDSEPEDDIVSEEGDYEERVQEFMESYNTMYHMARNSVHITDHPVSLYMKEFFDVLGFDMDNTSVNKHSEILKDALKKVKVAFTTDFYKISVIAYIFIYVNNMGIGYPIAIPGCVYRSNDDPEFILCAALKSGFLVTDKKVNLSPFISKLTELLDTKIIPADITEGITKTFTRIKVNEPKKKQLLPIIVLEPSPMRFPLIGSSKASDIKNNTKEKILTKINKKIQASKNKEEIKMLKTFEANFDKYIQGELFRKINTEPSDMERKLLIPFIKEYKERVLFEEDKFYSALKKKDYATGKNFKEFEDTVKNDINSRIKEALKRGKVSKNDREALNYVLDNHEKIIRYTPDDIRDLKLSLNTADEKEKEIIQVVVKYKKIFSKLLKKIILKQKENEENVLKNRLQEEKTLKKLKI